MKIGILSQPLKHNYGGTLQNYALQHELRRMGHTPITINWGVRKSWVKWLAHFVIDTIRGQRCSVNPYKEARQDKNFIEFHRQHIAMTRSLGLINPKFIESQGFEYYVVGSDQVWRKAYNTNIEYMYLSFVSDKIGRLAYAASIGVDKWDYSPSLTNACRKNLAKFDAVSVREISALRLLEDNFGYNADLVLDPTLLLHLDDYEQDLGLSSASPKNEIAVYILDMNDDKRNFVKELSRATKCSINVIGNPVINGDFVVSKSFCYPKIEHWLEAIRDARYVVTDSFHGTAFAINFHSCFISLGNHERGIARFDSLLGLFGLKDRLLDLNYDVKESLRILKSEINWVEVEVKRELLCKKSLEILKKIR